MKVKSIIMVKDWNLCTDQEGNLYLSGTTQDRDGVWMKGYVSPRLKRVNTRDGQAECSDFKFELGNFLGGERL
jgi:hypothetical protein